MNTTSPEINGQLGLGLGLPSGRYSQNWTSCASTLRCQVEDFHIKMAGFVSVKDIAISVLINGNVMILLMNGKE